MTENELNMLDHLASQGYSFRFIGRTIEFQKDDDPFYLAKLEESGNMNLRNELRKLTKGAISHLSQEVIDTEMFPDGIRPSELLLLFNEMLDNLE